MLMLKLCVDGEVVLMLKLCVDVEVLCCFLKEPQPQHATSTSTHNFNINTQLQHQHPQLQHQHTTSTTTHNCNNAQLSIFQKNEQCKPRTTKTNINAYHQTRMYAVYTKPNRTQLIVHNFKISKINTNRDTHNM